MFCEQKKRFPSPSSVTQQLVRTFCKQAEGGNDHFTQQRRSAELISANRKWPSCSLLPTLSNHIETLVEGAESAVGDVGIFREA